MSSQHRQAPACGGKEVFPRSGGLGRPEDHLDLFAVDLLLFEQDQRAFSQHIHFSLEDIERCLLCLLYTS